MRGWRADVTRRVGRGMPRLLPEPGDIGQFFADGLFLWAMTAVYFILPQIVIAAVTGFQSIDTVLTIVSWLLQLIFDSNQAVSFGVLLSQIGVSAIVGLIAPIGWGLLAYPFYRVAMANYAVTGNVLAFFDLFSAARIMVRHAPLVMGVFLFDVFTTSLFVSFSGALVTTVAGALLVPILLFPMIYWTNGYLFGVLASRIAASKKKPLPNMVANTG